MEIEIEIRDLTIDRKIETCLSVCAEGLTPAPLRRQRTGIVLEASKEGSKPWLTKGPTYPTTHPPYPNPPYPSNLPYPPLAPGHLEGSARVQRRYSAVGLTLTPQRQGPFIFSDKRTECFRGLGRVLGVLGGSWGVSGGSQVVVGVVQSTKIDSETFFFGPLSQEKCSHPHEIS